MRTVLVNPRDPNNIGAAARAMANFDLADLVVVAPHPPVWDEVRSAIGAGSVLREARVVRTLAEAVADMEVVGGTTAGTRRVLDRVLDPEHFFATVERESAWERAALVFGNEKRGLRADELALCTHTVRIATSEWQPSLNLAQAVAICCYESWRRRGLGTSTEAARPRRIARRATAESLDRIAAVVERRLAEHRDPSSATRAGSTLRRLLVRAGATEPEVAFVRGLLEPHGR